MTSQMDGNTRMESAKTVSSTELSLFRFPNHCRSIRKTGKRIMEKISPQISMPRKGFSILKLI